MADNSNIEWTDHTFNPWRGCVKVSPGCDNCYAETLSHRNPAALGEWGKDAARVIAAEAYWKKPLKWERNAEAFYAEHGRRQRVFCASLGDVFENRPDLAEPRLRLLDLIRRTPSLDWLLLTKRPKNVLPLLRAARDGDSLGAPHDDWKHMPDAGLADWLDNWVEGIHPTNVWIGTSVEDQERADQRVPALLKVPAAVRFLSCEPLLGPVNLHRIGGGPYALDALAGEMRGPGGGLMGNPNQNPGIDWVIVGGESGPGARPMHPDWARSLRDQCAEAGVPFLFKQWGAYVPYEDDPQPPFLNGQDGEWIDGHGLPPMLTDHIGELHQGWMIGLTDDDEDPYQIYRHAGKKAAGRALDSRTHDGFPE